MDGLVVTDPNFLLLDDVWKVLELPYRHHSVPARELRVIDQCQVIPDELGSCRVGRPTSKIFLGQVTDLLDDALRPFERETLVRKQVPTRVWRGQLGGE